MSIKKVTQVTAVYEDDCSSGLAYIVEKDNGEVKILSFIEGEPEDNNLSRNFNQVYCFLDIMKEVALSENVVFETKDFDTDWGSFEAVIKQNS